MRRLVIASLLGIAVLLAGSVGFIEWLGRRDRPPGPVAPPEQVAAAPGPVAPVVPERPPAVAPPPATAVAPPELEQFLRPTPMAVPPPAEPPPPVDLARAAPALQARVSSRCGSLQVRLGDVMRQEGEQMAGQALLLFDVEPRAGRVKFLSSRLQSHGNMRPALVACAQWALKGQEFPARGTAPGERFTVQVVVGMRPE